MFRLLMEAGAPWRTNQILSNCATKGNVPLLSHIVPLVKDDQAVLDSMLQNACSGVSAESVILLLNSGANISTDRNRALYLAILNARLDIVRVLLERGADVGALYEGCWAIDLILRGNLGPTECDIVSLLMEHGSKSNHNLAQVKQRLKEGDLRQIYQTQAEDVLSQPNLQKKSKH